MVRSYRELGAWQRAMEIVLMVYDITSEFPGDERYELRSQLRRAAVSMPSNVAEGWGRGNQKVFSHHIDIALGSLCEVETQLLIAERLGYVEDKQRMRVQRQCIAVNSALRHLKKSLK